MHERIVGVYSSLALAEAAFALLDDLGNKYIDECTLDVTEDLSEEAALSH
jgi:hypothetical protein